MLLKRYRTHVNVSSIIGIILNILYIIQCSKHGLTFSQLSDYNFIINIIVPRRFINIVYIFVLAYLLGERNTYNVMNVLLIQDRKEIWKLRYNQSIIIAGVDSLLLLITFISVNMIYMKSWIALGYAFLTGIFIFFQLCASFIFIELVTWVFNSKRIGFIIIIAIGISDSYTPWFQLFYSRFSIVKDISDMNIGNILFKIICCCLINCTLIILGYVYSNRKEFLC